ncbi:Uncharacterised protein [Vibrio cholerae]|nr:Uncharacterised protein [Vibrio cholerae]CSI49857.1 Uncharacterised protein [Vibrio cholerae]
MLPHLLAIPTLRFHRYAADLPHFHLPKYGSGSRLEYYGPLGSLPPREYVPVYRHW